jgi:hypothetical protein
VAYKRGRGDGDAHYFKGEERTMVDAAREWVEKQAAELPALEAAIREGKLWKRAEHITKLWYRATETRVAELRASSAIRKQMNLSHAHRSLVSIMRALLTRHETFSTFLSEPLEGLQRWQSAFCGEAGGNERVRCDELLSADLADTVAVACYTPTEFILLITIVCLQLLVNIWMCVRASIDARMMNARAGRPHCTAGSHCPQCTAALPPCTAALHCRPPCTAALHCRRGPRVRQG